MLRFLSRLAQFQIEVIAPEEHSRIPALLNVVDDHHLHRQRLSELQQFRGSVYVNEGYFPRQALDEQGRHLSQADLRRWHLLITDRDHAIKACVSMCVYDAMPTIDRLALHEVLVRSTGSQLPVYETAVRGLMDQSVRAGLRFGEVGGWAVSPDVRNGAVTVATILAAWSLPRLFGAGDSMWVATVGKGKRAEKILSRMGGFQLADAKRQLPSFFDAGYNSGIDILGFDSRHPCPDAVDAINELCHRLTSCRYFAPRHAC